MDFSTISQLSLQDAMRALREAGYEMSPGIIRSWGSRTPEQRAADLSTLTSARQTPGAQLGQGGILGTGILPGDAIRAGLLAYGGLATAGGLGFGPAAAAGSGAGAGAATTYPLAATGPITATPIGAGTAGAAAAGTAGASMSSWVNWANLGSTVLGLVGADRAGDAQVGASREAIAESRRQFDTARNDLLPTIALGRDSADTLRRYNAGDMSAFTTSPEYTFNLGEGQKAIDRSLAARGKSLSGQGVKEGIRYASGMAANQSGQFVDRLLAAAGLGTTGAAMSANAGANSAAQIGNANMAAGNARASSYANMHGALQGGIQNVLLQRYLGV